MQCSIYLLSINKTVASINQRMCRCLRFAEPFFLFFLGRIFYELFFSVLTIVAQWVNHQSLFCDLFFTHIATMSEWVNQWFSTYQTSEWPQLQRKFWIWKQSGRVLVQKSDVISKSLWKIQFDKYNRKIFNHRVNQEVNQQVN